MITRYSRSCQLPVLSIPPGRYTDEISCYLTAFKAFVAERLLHCLDGASMLGDYTEPYPNMHQRMIHTAPDIALLHTGPTVCKWYWQVTHDWQ